MIRARPGRLRFLARLLTAGLAALGLLTLLVTLTPIVSWWGRALAGPWDDPTGDVLVVLGGSSIDGRTLGESSYWRSVYAVLAYREGGFRDVVLSGGGDAENGVAGLMGDFLRCQGVPAQAIHLEIHSRSTRENALFTKEILSRLPGRTVLMTSDYHMTRATRAFRQVGIDVLPRPIPDVLKRAGSMAARWGAFVDLTRETAALAYYRIRGWI